MHRSRTDTGLLITKAWGMRARSIVTSNHTTLSFQAAHTTDTLVKQCQHTIPRSEEATAQLRAHTRRPGTNSPRTVMHGSSLRPGPNSCHPETAPQLRRTATPHRVASRRTEINPAPHTLRHAQQQSTDPIRPQHNPTQPSPAQPSPPQPKRPQPNPNPPPAP